MIPELEIKMLREEIRKEFSEMRKLIMGKGIIGNWIKQDSACAMLNIKVRQIRNLRVHLDEHQKKVGCIRWRKGAGHKQIEYYKPDLEKYLSKITIS